MSAEVEDLTVEYTDEETGDVVIKELNKEVLSKGAWPTVMFFTRTVTRKRVNSANRRSLCAVTAKCKACSNLKASSRLQAKRKPKPLSTY